MNDKDLALMDEIMGVITQADEWQEIQLHDPIVTAATSRWNAAMEQAKAFLPENLYYDLIDANADEGSAIGDAGILFGIHAADVIRDVARSPFELSQRILARMEGGR